MLKIVRAIKMKMASDRRSSKRYIMWLIFIQALMIMYCVIPYHVLPYVYTPNVSYSDAMNVSLFLPGANYNVRQMPWLSAPLLPRVLTLDEHDANIKLLEAVHKYLTKYKIEYFMAYGNLLGSYLMHDLLPWDDDVDISVNYKQFKELANLVKDEEKLLEFGLQSTYFDTGKADTIKFFFKNSDVETWRDWKWPYIDATFYDHNDTHVWNMDLYGRVFVPIETFYPLKARPLSNLWLPAPQNTRVFLVAKYKHFKCMRFHFNHKLERPNWSTAITPCETLLPYYPFVHRRPHEDGVNETLKIGNMTLYTIYMKEGYYKPKTDSVFDLGEFEH